MKDELPNKSTPDGKRMQPVILTLAAGMVMCLLYLVSLSLWALTANMSTARDRPMLVSLEAPTHTDGARGEPLAR
ncbi:hypothetical protein C8N35_101995 [Breoghania corrubedonensis]|uniref:Uncharacterized protein n=1 Tax=Breoghania corrubedonensis TaxID=665038 RepID=A0A2T5VGU4_9HYPH|nr:hypothetical protein C8N35_101995 [Breoghania corrubedonensis]